jgi:hypothetical protein
LVTVVEDGLLISIDTYDPDDREAALARYAELAAPQRAALGETPAERLVAEYLRLMESRDIEALRSILCDDVAVEDHRPVAAPPAVGIDSAVKLADSAFTVTSKLRFQIEEVLKRDRRAVALRGSWHGSAADGAGDMTLPMALVVSLKDDKVATLDLYDPDDAQAIEARFGELVGE